MAHEKPIKLRDYGGYNRFTRCASVMRKRFQACSVGLRKEEAPKLAFACGGEHERTADSKQCVLGTVR